MKILTVFLIFLVSISTYSSEQKEKDIILGGVDVGNGMPVNSGFEIQTEFSSEESLIEHFNHIKESIKKGEHKTTKGLVRLGACKSKKIGVKSLHFKNRYNLGKNKRLKKSIKGAVKLDLFGCRFPDVVTVSDNSFSEK